MKSISKPVMGVAIGLIAGAVACAADAGRMFPAPGATAVNPDTPLRLTFAAPPEFGGGKIEIHDAASGAVVETIDTASRTANRKIAGADYQVYPVIITGNTAAIYPTGGTLAYDKSYYVTVDAGAFKLGADPSAAVTAPGAWHFTTKKSAPAATAEKLVVAADGTGDFSTVQGAIDFVPAENARRVVLEVRRGTYEEMVNVPRGKDRITIRGADRQGSVISYANNARFNPRVRSMMDVYASDFRLENITLRNTTAKGGSQAETLRVRADRCVLDHCDFSSLQDTLQLTGRVYVNECFVEGDVDFIWGSGTVYFNRCELKALNNGYLVQSRNGQERLGYIFVDCKLTATPNVTRYILARIEPGRFPYSHVAFLNCAMAPIYGGIGWQFDQVPNANGPLPPTDKMQFQEFRSTTLDGKPFDVSARHAASKQLTAAEAAKLRDIAQVLGGADRWDPTAAPR